MKKIIILLIALLSISALAENASAQRGKSRILFERSLDSLSSVKFMLLSDQGSHRNPAVKLDSIEAVRLTFPQTMQNRILFLTIKPTNAQNPDLWVDLNNNSVREPNEAIHSKYSLLAIKINKNAITFYGKIDSLQTHLFPTLPNDVKQLLIRSGQEQSICDRINSVDISRSTQMKLLDISGCKLEKVFLGANEELRNLSLDNNRMQLLKAIDLSKLERLSCRNNQLKTLDISGCKNLQTLNCSHNQLKHIKSEQLDNLTNLNYSSNAIDSIELSKFPSLSRLECSKNGIKTLTLTNSKLTHLNCSDNQITLLDLSKTEELKFLNCNKNALYKIIFPKKSQLEHINCFDNHLSSIDISSLPNLKNIDCSKNKLTKIDITTNNNLDKLKANANRLQSIKIDNANKLSQLNLAFNDFSELQLDNCTNLKALDCSNNRISSIGVFKCSELEELNISHNALSSLNISKENKIKSLSCYSNSITADNMALLLANLSASKRADTASVYLLNNNPVKERNDISSAEDVIKKMTNWRIYYVEVDNDTLINVNTVNYPHYDNVYLINLSPAKVRGKSFKLKINGIAPPYNVAIANEKMRIITQYESGASFVDINSLQNGVYNIRVAKEGKASFYNFIKN